MPTPTIRLESSSLLLVEGSEEQRFWRVLFRDTAYASVQVLSIGGKDNLSNVLPVITLTPGFTNVTWLGVMQDADERAGSAFQRICNALDKARLPVPSQSWQLTQDATRSVGACVLHEKSSHHACLIPRMWRNTRGRRSYWGRGWRA